MKKRVNKIRSALGHRAAHVAIEREYRAGQLSIREIGRQHGLSDTAIRNRAKAKGWTRDLSGAVRSRVREEVRALRTCRDSAFRGRHR